MYLCLYQSVFGKKNRTSKTNILDQLGASYYQPHQAGWIAAKNIGFVRMRKGCGEHMLGEPSTVSASRVILHYT